MAGAAAGAAAAAAAGSVDKKRAANGNGRSGRSLVRGRAIIIAACRGAGTELWGLACWEVGVIAVS